MTAVAEVCNLDRSGFSSSASERHGFFTDDKVNELVRDFRREEEEEE
jgi:hypothetical protein